MLVHQHVEPIYGRTTSWDASSPMPLGTVKVSELSRSPMKVLERVCRGERLVVLRHSRPIATIQPIDGSVLQPGGQETDIRGGPLGDIERELARLCPEAKTILTGARRGRVNTTIVDGFERVGGVSHISRAVIQDLRTRGYIRQLANSGGYSLTGRGIVVREELFRRAAGGREVRYDVFGDPVKGSGRRRDLL